MKAISLSKKEFDFLALSLKEESMFSNIDDIAKGISSFEILDNKGKVVLRFLSGKK